MIYEIINPSDPYTMETDDLAAATVATILLGRGRYGLEDHDGNTIVPVMLFGVPEPWFQQQFGKSCQELVDTTPNDGVATALESVIYGSFGDRLIYAAAMNAIDDPVKRADFAKRWQDRHSSLNDIGGRAQRYAAALRKKAGE